MAAEKLLRNEIADEIPDRQSVRLGGFVDRVGRNQTARSGYVIDYDRRIAGNIFADMAGDRTGVGVETSSGGKADEDADGLACVEILRIRTMLGCEKNDSNKA